MPVVGTKAAASSQGFGEFAKKAGSAVYVEDVFSTYLYDGGTSQSINNGIDLSTKGGLVWFKFRSGTGTETNNELYDTARGVGNFIVSNSTAAQVNDGSSLTAFNTNGFSIVVDPGINASGSIYASWTFRKQPKFFDVVTYTGDGVAGRTVPHNLGSTPGCIIVKATSAANDWLVYHTSLGNTQGMSISSTSAAATSTTYWNNTSPTSTQFTVGTSPRSNENGTTFVAYLFAHNAGGFGTSGTDNVISCGSYSGNGSASGPTVTLGYEPQWVMIKRASGGAADWVVFDNMRGMPVGSADATLRPNTADAETAATDSINPTATGFYLSDSNSNVNAASSTYIYIAIRRGPMKVPTSGTSVFAPVATTANGSTSITSNFPVDLSVITWRSGAYNRWWSDRLRGNQYAAYLGTSRFLFSNSTDSEQVYTDTTPGLMMASNTGVIDYAVLPSGYSGIYYNFRRAPGFMDVVCYTGTNATQTISHNLGVVPELMIVKNRNYSGASSLHIVYAASEGPTKCGALQWTDAFFAQTNIWNNTAPTASVFTVGNSISTGGSYNYVAYLFASVAGVSKVGSYSGTGGTQTISCGFAARFVLIKRTDSAGSWWIWDTARGMVAGTDPRLALNSTAAETNANWVYTDASGFQIVSTDATVNASGGTYIFLAIA